MLRNLLNDDCGAVLSAELVFIITILVIGMVTGWVQLQYGIVQELDDIGHAIGNLVQSYSFSGFMSTKAGTNTVKAFSGGSQWTDAIDQCDSTSGTSSIGCQLAPANEP